MLSFILPSLTQRNFLHPAQFPLRGDTCLPTRSLRLRIFPFFPGKPRALRAVDLRLPAYLWHDVRGTLHLRPLESAGLHLVGEALSQADT